MPKQSPSPDISFKSPVYSDSQQNVQYKTVHVVVVKPTTNNNQDSYWGMIFPLVLVIIIAVFILFILSKVKPGEKTNRILNILETLTNGLDRKINSGKL